MDENRAKLDKIDELLESTSNEKRIKFNINEIESIPGPTIEESGASEYSPEAAFAEPEIEDIISSSDNVIQDAETEEPAPSVVAVEPIAEEPAPVKEPAQAQQQTLCIIDETSTSVVIEQGPDISVNEIVSGVSTTKKAKEKKPKEPLKLKPVQIIIMAIVGLITLWVIMFTVDHTLAGNGISPVFSRETESFADGSVSYKGLGYKVQFKFDSQGNLTQQVCPFWQEGPNDIVEFPEQ